MGYETTPDREHRLADELRQADIDYAAGKTVSGEDLRRHFGLPPLTRAFGKLDNFSVPDDFDDPLPDSEIAAWEGNTPPADPSS